MLPHRVKQRVQAREGHRALRLDPTKLQNPGRSGLFRGVAQQDALADSGLPAQHQSSGATAAGRLEQVVDELALGAPAVEHAPTLVSCRPWDDRLSAEGRVIGEVAD